MEVSWFGKELNKIYYYNAKHITRLSDIVSVWTYSIDIDGQNKSKDYEHDKQLFQIDCKNKQWNMKQAVSYDANGHIQSDIGKYDDWWKDLPTYTIIDIIYKKFCITKNLKILK